MQFPHTIKDTPDGRGQGIFTDVALKRGDMVWKYEEGSRDAKTGTVQVWKSEAQVREHFATLDREKIQFWLSHVWSWNDTLVEDIDNSWYLNHSRTANNIGYHPDDTEAVQERIPEDLDLSATKDKTGEAHHVRGWRRLDSDPEKLKYDPRNSYARRDIAAGEELLEDYGEYHVIEWFEKLANEYDVMTCGKCSQIY